VIHLKFSSSHIGTSFAHKSGWHWDIIAIIISSFTFISLSRRVLSR
jgi:hypothetical protein